ncbi:MAG TPA: ATP-binding protein [Thermoplasmata archaeon]|nr:ATP-binding protein [Thermoplasmata archaeon]
MSLADPWTVFDFQVALKVIKHISSGIYRTPGGAIKELVNNAFDAQATVVQIDTDRPSAKSIVVRDNGIGMTASLVERAFQHIGASIKVSQESPYEGKIDRQVIGQFGIGILASAHVSKQVRIETFPKGEEKGLLIELDLRPYFEYEQQIKTLEEFTGGTVRYKEIARAGRTGTTVSLYKVERGSNFHRAITKKGLKLAEYPADSRSTADEGTRMHRFVERLEKEPNCRSIERLQGRDQLLWELGAISPVEYLEGGPIDPAFLKGRVKEIVDDIVARTKALKFKVYLDGIQVRKPILLPTPKIRQLKWDLDNPELLQDIRVFPIEFESRKPEIKAEGYILFQPNHVQPKEMQGLYPKVRFVGVGKYENNLYESLRGEHPLHRPRLSGELYVLSGLGDAINLDRSGFIELDTEFQLLRDNLVQVFSGGENPINRQVKQASSQHSASVREVRRKFEDELLHQDIREAAKQFTPSSKLEISQPPPKREVRWIRYPSVSVNPDSGEVVVAEGEDNPRLVRAILAVDKFLSRRPDGEKLRRELAEFLLEQLSET